MILVLILLVGVSPELILILIEAVWHQSPNLLLRLVGLCCELLVKNVSLIDW